MLAFSQVFITFLSYSCWIVCLTVCLIVSGTSFGNNTGLYETVVTLYNNICLNTVTLISLSSKKLNDCTSWSPKVLFTDLTGGKRYMPTLKNRYALHRSTDFTVIKSPIHGDHQCCTEASEVNTDIKFCLVDSSLEKASLTSQGCSLLDPWKDAQIWNSTFCFHCIHKF